MRAGWILASIPLNFFVLDDGFFNRSAGDGTHGGIMNYFVTLSKR